MDRMEESMEMTASTASSEAVSTASSESGRSSRTYSSQSSEDDSQEEKFQNSTRYQDEFKEMESLGCGSFGSVVKARHFVDKIVYAVKRIDGPDDKSLREARQLSKCQHPNVVRYYGSWRQTEENCEFEIERDDDDVETGSDSNNSTSNVADDGDGIREKDKATSDSVVFDSNARSEKVEEAVVLFIQMELCSTDLKSWLFDRNEHFNLDIMFDRNLSLAKQLFEGLAYVHANEIVHRDLKPANIFLTKDAAILKIGDFGLAKRTKRSTGNQNQRDTDGIGTDGYVAPEIDETGQATAKSDMYSAGIVLFELFSTFTTEREKFENILKPAQSVSIANIMNRWPRQGEIILSLVQPDPSIRPTACAVRDVMLPSKVNVDKPLNSI